MDTLTRLLISEDTYEMAMDMIDTQGMDMNAELAKAAEALVGHWPTGSLMDRKWRQWILQRRQGTEDVHWYEQTYSRKVNVQTGWAGMQLFNDAIRSYGASA
jgi:hypothetical protein